MRRVAFLPALVLAVAPLLTLGSAGTAGAVSDEASFRTAWDTATSVVLDADITLTCAGGGVAVRTGDADVALNGRGHTISQEDGCDERVLVVADISDASATLRDVTIRGGRTRGFGGGLLMDNLGDMTIIDSYFTDNIACGDGGAIDSEGDTDTEITISGTTIAGNSAPNAEAGAIWAEGTAISITNSTITDNTGGNDISAIADAGGSLTTFYTDIVDNPFEPGGLCVFSAGTGYSAGTHADDGSGSAAAADGQIQAETFAPFGTVITGNVDSSNCNSDDPMTTNSAGYNLASDSSCGLNDPTDVEGVTDPGLGALADNGGPTLTLLPQTGSPLVDQIPASSPCAGVDIVVDQRGLPRPTTAGQLCDIGAVELQPVVVVVAVTPTFTG
jgi:predicted outer membrane repeat protein